MSLLLDALKRAAQEKLEKQRQDETGAGNGTEADDALSLDITETGTEDNDLKPDTLPPSNTDLRLHRADVLASELQAFMGRGNTEQGVTLSKEAVDKVEPVERNAVPASGAFAPSAALATPAAAALMFTNKRAGIRSKQGILIAGAGVALLLIVVFYVVSLGSLNRSNVYVDRVRGNIPLPEPHSDYRLTDGQKIEKDLLVEQEAIDPSPHETPAQEKAPTTGSAANGEQTAQSVNPFANNTADTTAQAESESADVAPRTTAPRLTVQRKRQEALHDILLRAYNAYQSNDIAAAAAAYRQALARAPENRDALLGFAATAIQQGDYAAAMESYIQLLNLDPNDDLALAGIAGLRQGVQGTPADESVIKRLLLKRPESAQLHFALGNLYSAAADWPKAQSAYFDAYRFDSQNPDYAYNLAVSLEHMQQVEVALRYYELALTLAAARKPNFDSAQAAARVSILQAQNQPATDAR